jgi:hypothetical protein
LPLGANYPPEVRQNRRAVRANRWGHRDSTAILLAYRHGLRASERSVAQRQEIDETIANIDRSIRVVEGYIRNIRRKFSDHLSTIFFEAIE